MLAQTAPPGFLRAGLSLKAAWPGLQWPPAKRALRGGLDAALGHVGARRELV